MYSKKCPICSSQDWSTFEMKKSAKMFDPEKHLVVGAIPLAALPDMLLETVRNDSKIVSLDLCNNCGTVVS